MVSAVVRCELRARAPRDAPFLQFLQVHQRLGDGAGDLGRRRVHGELIYRGEMFCQTAATSPTVADLEEAVREPLDGSLWPARTDERW